MTSGYWLLILTSQVMLIVIPLPKLRITDQIQRDMEQAPNTLV